MPHVPLLALTATATPEVAEDIQRRLGFVKPNVMRGDFMRGNLAYVVRNVNDKDGELVRIIKGVHGCAIVYVRRRSATLDVAALLDGCGIRALPYHAGMTVQERNANQEAWMSGKVTAIVATNAFGMGIDKPDVRVVVHYDVPDSPEAYFQEAGRAGRDGQRSYAVLLANGFALRTLRGRVAKQFPSLEKIREIYSSLCDYFNLLEGEGMESSFPFDKESFCKVSGSAPDVVSSAMMLLQGAGYIEVAGDLRNKGRLVFKVERRELDRLDLDGTQERVVEFFLRNMSGVFSGFVYFSEAEVAGELGMERDGLYDVLLKLSREGVVVYVPGDHAECVVMKQPRMPESYVELPYEVYGRRKEAYRKRIEAMAAYITSEGECRQRFLMRYFGMEGSEDCGVCDVCLGKKKQHKLHAHVDREVVRLLERNGTMDLHELTAAFNGAVPAGKDVQKEEMEAGQHEVIDALRRLLDSGRISYSALSKVSLNK